MINPIGYNVYNQGQMQGNNLQQVNKAVSVGHTSTPTESQAPKDSSQKFIPSNDQSATLEGKFDQKILKQLEVLPCETCDNRRYQDGSDDPSVSFQTPTHISPEMSGAMVASHEQEHVSHESVKAEQEGREVISQSVRLFSGVCPECGKTYISGGETKTTTAKKQEDPAENFKGNLVDLKL